MQGEVGVEGATDLSQDKLRVNDDDDDDNDAAEIL